MAYNFNSDARYAAGIVGTSKEGLVVAFTQSSVYVQSGGGSFQARYPQYVREVSPAPCVFRQNRACMEF